MPKSKYLNINSTNLFLQEVRNKQKKNKTIRLKQKGLIESASLKLNNNKQYLNA